MDYKKYPRVKIIQEIDEKYALAECGGFKFKIRKDKIDAFSINEAMFNSGYFQFLEINENDVIADIGGHIGSFTVPASKLAKHIYTFEPDKENCEMIMENLRLNNITNVTVINKAVMQTNEDAILYLNKGVCSDCHTTFATRGREKITVPSIAFEDIIKMGITKFKIDCEGSELDFLRLTDLSKVERFIAEVHFYISYKDKHERYFQMMNNIKKYFSQVKEPVKIPNMFARIIRAKK